MSCKTCTCGGTCSCCKKDSRGLCSKCGMPSCNCMPQKDTNDKKIVTITAQELKKKNETSSGHTVINVLDEAYYQQCHIKGSINIPFDTLEKKVASWDKDKDIVVYCAHSECPMSVNAYKLLKKLGFTRVTAYEGGIKEWHELGYPVEGECAKE